MILSCTHQESSDDAFKDVPIIIDIKSVKSTPLKLGHIQYIPLETSDECLIGTADKALIRDNKIYVADFDHSMALFIFDMTGKYISKISRRGQGPGEYLSFKDFDIQTNGEIYIYDNSGKKFLIYNPEGECLREIAVDFYFLGFCLVDDKIYWSRPYANGKMFANLAIYNITNKKTDFIFKDKKFLYDIDIVNFNSHYFYYSPDNITYYSPKFSKIIYSIGKDGVRPAIGIKNLNIPQEHIIEGWLQVDDVFERSQLATNFKYFIENAYIYETDKYITFGCIRNIVNDVLFYNKHSKSICAIMPHEYFSKMGSDRVKGSTGKEFFGIITFDSNNESHKKILASREELKNWKEDDNPVIVLFEPDM
jgi:hypothetical protein